MDRLTEYVDGEVIQVQNVKVGHKACMRKLAAYEDTGLEPKEVDEMSKESEVLHKLLKTQINVLKAMTENVKCLDCLINLKGDYINTVNEVLDKITEVLKND